MLINLIREHALADAQAGNWSAVAATLNAQTITLEGLRLSGKQTIVGLVSLGRDPDAIRLVLEGTPSGRGLLDLLPGAGVNWVDPLTLQVLQKNTGSGMLSQSDVDALKSLSSRKASLASQQGLGEVTPQQCQQAWLDDVAFQRRNERRAIYDAFENAVGTVEQDARKSDLLAALESV